MCGSPGLCVVHEPPSREFLGVLFIFLGDAVGAREQMMDERRTLR